MNTVYLFLQASAVFWTGPSFSNFYGFLNLLNLFQGFFFLNKTLCWVDISSVKTAPAWIEEPYAICVIVETLVGVQCMWCQHFLHSTLPLKKNWIPSWFLLSFKRMYMKLRWSCYCCCCFYRSLFLLREVVDWRQHKFEKFEKDADERECLRKYNRGEPFRFDAENWKVLVETF